MTDSMTIEEAYKTLKKMNNGLEVFTLHRAKIEFEGTGVRLVLPDELQDIGVFHEVLHRNKKATKSRINRMNLIFEWIGSSVRAKKTPKGVSFSASDVKSDLEFKVFLRDFIGAGLPEDLEYQIWGKA